MVRTMVANKMKTQECHTLCGYCVSSPGLSTYSQHNSAVTSGRGIPFSPLYGGGTTRAVLGSTSNKETVITLIATEGHGVSTEVM